MSQDNARSGRMAECSSFRTRELNMIWKNLSELASIPTRGSRLAGGWSSATVMTSGSADVRSSQPVSEKKTQKAQKRAGILLCFLCLLRLYLSFGHPGNYTVTARDPLSTVDLRSLSI